MTPGRRRTAESLAAGREPFELRLHRRGLRTVAGVDEAGRGALFGPVVAAAAVVDPHRAPPRVDDSKRLSARQRRICFLELVDWLEDWAVGIASATEIDRINVLQATRRAMLRAIAGLRRSPEHLLVDGRLHLPGRISQTPLVGGDARCLSIAAASVIAKVTRDGLIDAYARRLPGYGLARHKGYGTLEHRVAVTRRGLSPLHRRTFRAQGHLPFDDEEP